MRFEDDDENPEDFRESIGLGTSPQKRHGFRNFIRWFFTVDFKDWTNYVAIVLAGFLFWWGIKNIMKAMAFQ